MISPIIAQEIHLDQNINVEFCRKYNIPCQILKNFFSFFAIFAVHRTLTHVNNHYTEVSRPAIEYEVLIIFSIPSLKQEVKFVSQTKKRFSLLQEKILLSASDKRSAVQYQPQGFGC